jgi:enamine deaminase RidA (YjgF/YER057c/UK114 family)
MPADPSTSRRMNVPGLSRPPGYTHVAVARGSRLVFTAGQVPLDEAGRLVGPGDLVAQTHQVLANLAATLAAAGASPEDVVKSTVYVVAREQDDLAAVWRAFQEFGLPGLRGAPSTLLAVSRLGYTGQLVEIEAVAVVDEREDAP